MPLKASKKVLNAIVSCCMNISLSEWIFHSRQFIALHAISFICFCKSTKSAFFVARHAQFLTSLSHNILRHRLHPCFSPCCILLFYSKLDSLLSDNTHQYRNNGSDANSFQQLGSNVLLFHSADPRCVDSCAGSKYSDSFSHISAHHNNKSRCQRLIWLIADFLPSDAFLFVSYLYCTQYSQSILEWKLYLHRNGKNK